MDKRWKETIDESGKKTWYRKVEWANDLYEVIKLIDGKFIIYEDEKPWFKIPNGNTYRWNSTLAQAKDTWKRINEGRLPLMTQRKSGNRVKL